MITMLGDKYMQTKVKSFKIIALLFAILFVLTTILSSTITADAAVKTGWIKTGNPVTVKYRFSNGKCAKHELMLDNQKHKYLFDNNCNLVFGYNQYYDGMYVKSDGTTSGTNVGKWKVVNGYIRYYANGKYLKNTSVRIDGTTYYFDAVGNLLTKKNGAKVKNNVKSSNGKTYYIANKSVNYPMYLLNASTHTQKLWTTTHNSYVKYTTNVLKVK